MSPVPGEYYLVKTKCITVVVSVHLAALRFRLSFYVLCFFCFLYSFLFLSFIYLFIYLFITFFFFFFSLFHVDCTNCPISLHPA